MSIGVYCADIGSMAGNRFGWSGHSRGNEASGDSASGLARGVAVELNAGVPIALGFECPLFVPVPAAEHDLGCARHGEGARPWSAAAGAAALATGLVQAVWVLREIRRNVGPDVCAHLACDDFMAAGQGLLLWEAFVSGSAKRADHCSDAEAAVIAFEGALATGQWTSGVTCPEETYSLIGAALLRSGWSDDPSVLSKSCLVIKAFAVKV